MSIVRGIHTYTMHVNADEQAINPSARGADAPGTGRSARHAALRDTVLRDTAQRHAELRDTILRDTVLRDDGAAMIIVLTIIFVMTTLGGIALLATLTNLRMSVKVASWTSEYYELDKAAEDCLRRLDARLLEAEGYAYEYMRGEYYRIGDAVPKLTGESATDVNDKVQDFIYNNWYTGVYKPSLVKSGGDGTDDENNNGGNGGGDKGSSNGSGNGGSGGGDNGSSGNGNGGGNSGGDNSSGNGGNGSGSNGSSGVELIDENRYNNLFIRFHTEFFQRLYYYFSYKLINRDVRNGVFESIELSPEMAGFAGMLENYANDPKGMKVAFGVSDGKADYAKHVSASVYVSSPVFGFETQSEDIPFKANPIWSGALAARGSIRFSPVDAATGADSGNVAAETGVARVFGDVSSIDCNEFYLDQNDWASPAGNEYGVASDGAHVEIYGNVYSRGDLHVIGGGGTITVRRYKPGFSAEYKKGLFGNTLYFDTSVTPVMIQRYTQPDDGSWSRSFIPFFYRDGLGGNVYCNNLSIEAGAHGAAIRIENGPVEGGEHGGMAGVAWTLDDVQNDGHDSLIRVEGNLIGISSDATFDDHTSSSAVINTNYDSGAIELMGAVITPGTGFMQFNGVNDMMDENTFFETAESVSATNPAILSAYTEKPGYDPGVLYFYDRYSLDTERGLSDFFLVNYAAMNDMARHLVSVLSGRIPDTGITVRGDLEGYARGAVIGRDDSGEKRMFGAPGFGDIDGYREIRNYSENYLAYSEIKDSLKAAYRVKTESFGTSGYKFGDFVKLSAVVDPTGRVYPNLNGAITFFIGDGELELDGEKSGIVYCASAMDGSIPRLSIRGDGSFRGTIISEGDIFIEGAPSIYYDEKLISKILLFYPEIRDFFSPGEIGDTSYVRVMGVAQGMTKIKKERYKVVSWTEWQE